MTIRELIEFCLDSIADGVSIDEELLIYKPADESVIHINHAFVSNTVGCKCCKESASISSQPNRTPFLELKV